MDVKRKMTPSVPANYVSILHLRERWIKEKEQKRKEPEEEERRRNQHAVEQQTIQDDLKKPREDLDETRLNRNDQKHCGKNGKKDESIDCGEARLAEKETAAIRSERVEGEGLSEKKRGRRKRYDRKKKKRTNQEVDECGSIKPVKDQIQVYRKKENKSVEKAVTAVETQFEHLSIKRGQETKKLEAQTRNDLPLGRATMVWVKKGKNERAADGNGSGVKPLHA